ICSCYSSNMLNEIYKYLQVYDFFKQQEIINMLICILCCMGSRPVGVGTLATGLLGFQFLDKLKTVFTQLMIDLLKNTSTVPIAVRGVREPR
ncbi:hypothetical protein ACJX0J_023101, partial [Zea mays]